MKKIIILFAIISLAVGLQAKTILKTYDFKDSNNKTIELQTMDAGVYIPTYKNKAVLLAFFGKNCPPCRAEIPGFVKLQKKLGNKFQIIAIHVQQKMTKPELENFISMHNINYPVIPATSKAFEFANFIASKTGWGGQIPFSLLFDKQGNVVNTYLGMQREETLTKAINSIK
jgi:thiol-disulfide isomerase/thioredoxin